uniref:single-stranded DNA cytosine deaminase n=1 Tax=Tupaia belangeri TaxID=37347 RepID=A0A219T5B8_TUPBE|nr:APOBEC3 [Tupaia belangeri]
MKLLFRKTFYFHFQNLLFASGRNTTFLCCRVDKVERHGTVPLVSGVFTHQVWSSYHAESHFLLWFQKNFLSLDKDFQVTWYLSWSPCPACAKQVADFLAVHRNVSLTIFSARLYYFWDPEFRDGLHRLFEKGARVAIMSPKDFENCWEGFVFNEGRDFRPWDNMVENYQSLRITLQEILRYPMERLFRKTFYFHFQNRLYASRRNTTFLCYRVDREERPGTVSLARGVWRNQVHPTCHAELRFLSWFQSNMLCPNKDFQVTWYLSWSPCPNCAKQVADFLAAHRNVSLTILTARLYYFWDQKFRNGLRSLSEEGARVAIMSPQDFKNCWEDFVWNKGWNFTPRFNVGRNYQLLASRLEEILGPHS